MIVYMFRVRNDDGLKYSNVASKDLTQEMIDTFGGLKKPTSIAHSDGKEVCVMCLDESLLREFIAGMSFQRIAVNNWDSFYKINKEGQ